MVRYADDTDICFTSEDIFDLEIQTYINLNSCIQYFKNINLQSNSSKTNYIVFETRSSNNKYSPAVFMDEDLLEEVDSTKFLEIIIDKGLTWNDHVD